ncbi:MAG: hypothetical protein HPY55_01405 [Firmicutes bacterium]|nr:hypothetical protein [Bacillota bacterium]
MLTLTGKWKEIHPGALAGILAMDNVSNPERHTALEREKERLVEDLKKRIPDREMLASLPVIRAYDSYYRRFDKSYHVRMQIESVALKGKPIPNVAALVETMFMAELKNGLLTAGHDLDAVEGLIRADLADGGEIYTRLNGQEQACKAGDMIMADEGGIISSVLYGPDWRTRITPGTRRVCFAVYVPEGIGEDALQRHFDDIEAYIRLVSPDAATSRREVRGAGFTLRNAGLDSAL